MSKVEDITPYGPEGDRDGKAEQIRRMFDGIAPSYDLMNRLMTLGIDRLWRRRCVRLAAASSPRRILDIATGTADLAAALAKAIPGARVTGVDLSESMLEMGRRKLAAKGLSSRVDLRVADALDLPFDAATFDTVTIAFGVRNFEHLERGYAEMLRVLKPGGRLIVLELTQPASKTVLPLYRFYTGKIIPAVGRLLSGDTRAYSYLPESIAAVPARDDMTALMTRVGLTDAAWQSLTSGTATIYTASRT